jgi:aspartyl-tRNA(Asn)/glutamyl-tRNA(Gln) amidotransferase subunit A
MSDDSITRRGVLAGAAATAALAAVGNAPAQRARGDELTKLSIAEAGRRIAAGDLSPVELTQAYLDRIARVDGRVNAYITVLEEQALAQARRSQEELARGQRRGPLHGIPLALKDNIDTAGTITTAASAVYADRVPAEDAECVRKLRDAGAVLLGKLNMHEFAYGGTSAVTHFGPVHNPWNLDHHPGGSSGGSGAAVAARLCAAALGTDTAASVRYPAACCGVVGLKATHGLASIRGIVPLSELHDHVGPLARSVADAALVMNALVGFDPLDPVSIRAEAEDLHAAIGREVRDLRIGLPRSPFFEQLDPEIDAAIARAVEVLVGLTGPTRDVTLTAPETYALLDAETYAYHAPLLADAAKRALYQPLTLQRVMGGGSVSAQVYIEQRRQMTIARNTIDRLFADVDVLVAPTCMALPATVAAVLANPAAEGSLIRNTLPFNVLGIPAISVPCGFARNTGLPIGMQIIGPKLGEARVLALAHAYEQATEWHRREPSLA